MVARRMTTPPARQHHQPKLFNSTSPPHEEHQPHHQGDHVGKVGVKAAGLDYFQRVRHAQYARSKGP